MIEEAGFAYAPPAAVVPNTRLALELAELARDHGRHAEVHDRLMRAYWSEGVDIGDPEALVDLVGAAGVDADEARAAIADRRYRERVDGSTRMANAAGINAIPAFVLDRRFLLLGAQPHDVFDEVLAELDADPQPAS
jgi:predicted DsbA family dithiol-disulfide isomerase